MANYRSKMREKLVAVLPFVMPAIGGMLGVIYLNTADGFPIPFLWVGIGILGGWLAGRVLVRLLDR
ncbi:hypothetical protein [Shimia sagamensis]|uniref:AtpZ/AtpI family protein n=1 Tax=Shimia sagamensis TaxID=1566352 RepID=A0ABY1PDB3_9RHOB|nr:hypothetical protein [Shimia sagamensis]SMP31917.1 hypothetical protein SAMN06265373_10898 [Shimia sagamensis]